VKQEIQQRTVGKQLIVDEVSPHFLAELFSILPISSSDSALLHG
jgi:hypothetical protein